METCVCFMSKRQEPVLEQLIFHSVGLVYFWESAYHHLQEECSLLFSLVPSTPVHSHGCVRTCPRTAFPAPWIPQHNRVHRSHLQATCSPNVEHGMKQPPRQSTPEHSVRGAGGHSHLHCQVRGLKDGESWDLFKTVQLVTEPRPQLRSPVPRVRFSQQQRKPADASLSLYSMLYKWWMY